MKKLVSLFLVLVLTLAAVSAFAAPKNISEIQDLPEFPTVPSMKVKSSGSTTTVTMDTSMSWLAVVRNWVWENLEFNEENVATYSTAGQKVSPGFGVWGWKASVNDINEDWVEVVYDSKDADTSDWVDGSYSWKWKNGMYGEHYYYYEKLVKHDAGYERYLPTIVYDWYENDEGEWVEDIYLDGRQIFLGDIADVDGYMKEAIVAEAKDLAKAGIYTEKEILDWASDVYLIEWGNDYPDGYITVGKSDKFINGGAYDMIFAYDGDTTDGVHVRYDTHGRLVSAAVTLTGKNYLGLEQAPTKSVVTFSTGKNAKNKSVVYISNITEEIDENTKVSADFAQNGKCLRIK